MADELELALIGAALGVGLAYLRKRERGRIFFPLPQPPALSPGTGTPGTGDAGTGTVSDTVARNAGTNRAAFRWLLSRHGRSQYWMIWLASLRPVGEGKSAATGSPYGLSVRPDPEERRRASAGAEQVARAMSRTWGGPVLLWQSGYVYPEGYYSVNRFFLFDARPAGALMCGSNAPITGRPTTITTPFGPLVPVACGVHNNAPTADPFWLHWFIKKASANRMGVTVEPMRASRLCRPEYYYVICDPQYYENERVAKRLDGEDRARWRKIWRLVEVALAPQSSLVEVPPLVDPELRGFIQDPLGKAEELFGQLVGERFVVVGG